MSVPRPSLRPRPWRGALTLCALVAASSCTAGSSDDRQAAPTASAVPSTGRSFELAGFSPLTVAVPDEPVATAPTSVPGTDLTVYVVQRAGQAVTVVFGLRTTTAPASGDKSVGPRLGESYIDYTVGGVTLVDPVGLKQYLTLRPEDFEITATGPVQCACSSTRGGSELEPGHEQVFAASLAAPPADVTSVSLVTPMGTVPGLTITGG